MRKIAIMLMAVVMAMMMVGCGQNELTQNSDGDDSTSKEQATSQDTNIKLTKGNPKKLKRSEYESDEDYELAISEQYDEIEGYAVTSDAVVGEDIPAGTYYVYNSIDWPQITINEGEEDEELIDLGSGDSCTLKEGQKISCTSPCKFEPVQ